MPERVLAILGFHKIGKPSANGEDTWFYVSEVIFSGFLARIRDDGWTVIDLPRLLDGLTAPEHLPERSALLTFDDGYKSMRDVTLPLLRQFGYPAVLFVPSDFIGGSNDFDAGVEPAEAICNWDDLRELQRQGVSIQSHSVSHRGLSTLSPAEVEHELRQSRVALEAGLGQPVEMFSYPYGDGGLDPEFVRQALERTGYRAACLYGGGPNLLPVENRFRLTRLAIGPDTDLQAALKER